jgi:translation initiation factor 3 subunit K
MPGAPSPPQIFTIEQLVALNPYNPDILPDLESYVEEQVATQTYSLDCNLCLLRLYQFQPARMNVHIIIKVLAKALMALPATDFNLCMFLIPERLVSFFTDFAEGVVRMTNVVNHN